MKRCPLCNRTYADETISFCLADGALLSAPYDSQATEQFPTARSTDPPPTEILPHTPGLNPTQPAKEILSQTIASPVSPNREKFEPQAAPAMRRTSGLPWIIGGLFVLIAISIVFIIGYNMGGEKAERSNGNASGGNPGLSSTPEAIANASPDNSSLLTPPSSAPDSAGAANINQNNAGIGSGKDAVANGNTAPSPATGVTAPVDYNKIFKPTEVDQKARILSKPTPSYTDEARQNQITGTVVLQLVLSASGNVTDIKAVSGLPYGLTERAIAAARQIQFTPAMKDGRAVSQYIRVEYNFNMY